MDRADETRAEHIGEIGGHGREPAAVHRGNDAEGADEEPDRSPDQCGRRKAVESKVPSARIVM